MSGTIAISWGRFGGLYITRNRVCAGWVAVTYAPVEIDELMRAHVSERDAWEEYDLIRALFHAVGEPIPSPTEAHKNAAVLLADYLVEWFPRYATHRGTEITKSLEMTFDGVVERLEEYELLRSRSGDSA